MRGQGEWHATHRRDPAPCGSAQGAAPSCASGKCPAPGALAHRCGFGPHAWHARPQPQARGAAWRRALA
eukprot:5188639-Lingulodinium_polyedra.AAC.1